jgi:tetratricopeptide (TPR) repeat protein
MRRFFIVLYVVLFCSAALGQNAQIEFYKDSLKKAPADSNKAYCLYILSYYYQNYKPDSALTLAQSAYELSKKSSFLRGKIGSLGQIALAFNKLGNFSKALKYYIEQLKLIETTQDPYDIGTAYLSIALIYNSQKDVVNALNYAYKADSILWIHHVDSDSKLDLLDTLSVITYLDIGEIYSDKGQLDSALQYTLTCYQKSLNLKYPLITGTALNNLGNIYLKKADFDNALNYFRSSIPLLDSTQDYNTLAECYYGMAQSFEKKSIHDSALYYAKRSFTLASENKFLKHSVNASNFLSTLYKEKNNIDSAFAFLETYVILKDSLDNAEKIKQLQNLTITEEQRQRDLALQKAEEAKDRRLKLELLLVGMFIPILFFVTAFISGRRVHKKIIKFSGIFSLLFLFEYITIFLHPWVVEETGHSPVYEIFIFVAIAAIISPTHHRIEAWLINRLNTRHQRRVNKALAAKAVAEAAGAAAAEAKLAAENQTPAINK